MTGKVKIEVSQEVRNEIRKAFGVSNQTVVNALNYSGGTRSQSDLAKRIRSMAMNNGGRHMLYLPECETIHDEGTGEMIQTFGNGAKLIINKETGNAMVTYPNGCPYLGYENVIVRQIPALQEIAASL